MCPQIVPGPYRWLPKSVIKTDGTPLPHLVANPGKVAVLSGGAVAIALAMTPRHGLLRCLLEIPSRPQSIATASALAGGLMYYRQRKLNGKVEFWMNKKEFLQKLEKNEDDKHLGWFNSTRDSGTFVPTWKLVRLAEKKWAKHDLVRLAEKKWTKSA